MHFSVLLFLVVSDTLFHKFKISRSSFMHSKTSSPHTPFFAAIYKYVLGDKIPLLLLWDCFPNDGLVITSDCMWTLRACWEHRGLQGGGLGGWGPWYSGMCGEGICKSFWLKENTSAKKFNRIISSRQRRAPLHLYQLLLYCSVELRSRRTEWGERFPHTHRGRGG